VVGAGSVRPERPQILRDAQLVSTKRGA
jgi:hypothetical protein